ncbi:MAG: DUF11 domain-containing protein, partial [Oscillospiraceae bacterium]|nr:DUF11 domain-containing protein [Oscillospiraceae bacterium]
MDRKKRILSGGFAGRIKIKSAIVGLLLILAMIAGQMSLMATTSLAAYPSPGQNVTLYEDGEYNKYDALGNYIYCIEFDKHFSSTEPNVGDRLAAGETVAEINANPVKQTKTAMGPAWGPFSEEDRALIAVANLMLNREQMKHYCWEFLRGGKYNYGVGSHAFFQWPEFPPPDYSLDFVPQNTLLNRYYGKYQMLYTKSAYSGEPSVATRTIVDNNPATAGLDWQMIDAPAGVTFTHTGNQFKFDYANPTIQDFSVTLEVYFSRGPDLIYYWGTQADQICIIPGQELKKRVTIFFHVDPAEVVISKRADVPPGKVMKAGDEITYTIDVTNIGTGVMPNYGVEDPLPEYVEYVRSTGGNSRNYNSGTHTVRWELGDIQSKQTISLTVTVRVKEMGLDECARFIVNIAYGDDGASSNEVTHEQCASHLTLVKESDPPHGTVMKQGDTITYKLTVLNSGPQDTSGNTVRDNIPDGTTLVPGSARVVSGGTAVAQENPPLEVVFTNVTIPAGGRIVLEFKVTVNPLPKGMMARSLLNQAFLNDVPGNPTEHFVYSGTLNGVKTANPPSGSIVKVGSNITYTIAIYNNGPDKMHDITVTDQVPDGTTFISAAPSPDSTEPLATGQQKLIWRVPVLEGGEEKKFSFTVRVDELPDGVKFRTIENMATVDDRPTNSTVHYVGSAEIVGVKRSNPMTGTTVYENDVIRYTIDVKNTGSEPSDTVVITDSLPDNLVYVNMLSSGSTGQGGSVTGTRTASGTTKDGIQKYDFKWEISKLEPLESFSVWFEARVPKMPQGIDSREFRNVAFVNGNNTNETEHYQYAGSLRAVKSADPPDGSLVYEGTEITYTIKVYNDGADTLYNIPVTDQAPTGTTIIGTPTLSGTGAAGSGTAAGNVASWTITSLASGACATLQFRVRVGTMPENESSRTLRNTAQVGDFETNEVVHEQKNATLEISKTSSPTTGSIVYENDVITYSITVKNTGNDPSYNIKIKDKLPDNLNFVAGSMTNGSSPEGVSVTGAATNIGTTKDGVARYEFNWTVPKLEKGASVTVQFQGTVMKMPFGISERTFRNVGYVNNVPTNETEHSQYAGHLVAAKYSDPVAGTLVHEYDIITYTIEVINNGADTLYNIPAFDEIPAGTEYVPGSARLAVGTGPAGTAGTSFNSGLNRVEWVIPALESHQKAYLTFRVEVQRMPATETDRVIRNLATVDDFETNEVVHPQKNYTLAFSKTSDPITGTTVYEHDVITYSITVKNTGNDPVYDTVIKDKLPDNLQFVAGSVTTGTSPEGVALTGTATANGTTKDGIAKYDFQWTVPVLQRGQTVTVKFQGTVTKMPFGVSSREFRNVAYVNDIATNETEHYQYAGNLTAAKYADPVPGTLVHEYDIITYTIEVINNGADTLYNIPAFDDIPAGTAYVNGSVRMKIGTGSFVTTGCIYNSAEDRVEWVIPALQSAQKAVLEFKVEVQRMPETEADRTIYNIATVDDFETNEVVHPQKNYTLAFSKDSDPETGTIVYEHDIITYSVTVKNTGNDPAYNIVIKDKLPDNLAYIAGSITTGTSPEGIALTGTATANGATKDGITKYNFQWSIPKLEKGATVTVEFQAEVTKMPYGIDSREFRNVAYVNDRETNETEHYQHAGNLVAAKYADPIPGTLVHEHDIITYTVEVINNGADTLYDIPVFDEIPDNTVYQTGSVNMKIGTGAVVTAGCVYNSGLNRVEWVIPALKSHEKAVLTFQVEVGRLDKNEGTREIINVATVDDFQTNTVVHYQSNYDLQISKVSDPASGSTVYEKKPDGSGDTITYTVTVINTGNDPAYDVEI